MPSQRHIARRCASHPVAGEQCASSLAETSQTRHNTRSIFEEHHTPYLEDYSYRPSLIRQNDHRPRRNSPLFPSSIAQASSELLLSFGIIFPQLQAQLQRQKAMRGSGTAFALHYWPRSDPYLLEPCLLPQQPAIVIVVLQPATSNLTSPSCQIVGWL